MLFFRVCQARQVVWARRESLDQRFHKLLFHKCDLSVLVKVITIMPLLCFSAAQGKHGQRGMTGLPGLKGDMVGFIHSYAAAICGRICEYTNTLTSVCVKWCLGFPG